MGRQRVGGSKQMRQVSDYQHNEAAASPEQSEQLET